MKCLPTEGFIIWNMHPGTDIEPEVRLSGDGPGGWRYEIRAPEFELVFVSVRNRHDGTTVEVPESEQRTLFEAAAWCESHATEVAMGVLRL